MRVVERTSLLLTTSGVADNRRFFLVDERGRLVDGMRLGKLASVVAAYDHEARALTLTLPDGAVVEGTIALGEPCPARVLSRPVDARPLVGPWSGALSDFFGRTLRVVEGVRLDVVKPRKAVSLISRASVDGLARVAGTPSVDARRFRMLVEINGVHAHDEDAWVGATVRLGDALVRFGGHVGRCAITSQHPETGVVDLPTLDLLRSYRGGLDTTEPLAFGVCGEVLADGRVAVGDAVEVVPAS
jgi:uncharacterized protein YcbX